MQMALQFECWNARVGLDFWTTLYRKSFEEYKGQNTIIDIYSFCSMDSNILSFDRDSFSVDQNASSISPLFNDNGNIAKTFLIKGQLHFFGNINDFKSIDKQKLLNQIKQELILENDDLNNLVRFVMICWADLKKYRFYYQFCFPALIFNPPNTLLNSSIYEYHVTDTDFNKEINIKEMEGKENCNVMKFNHLINVQDDIPCIVNTCSISSFHLKDNKSNGKRDENETEKNLEKDSKTETNIKVFGWALRNLLARNIFKKYKIIGSSKFRIIKSINNDSIDSLFYKNFENYLITGWELNEKGKMAPKMIDLSFYLDPHILAKEASQLNLKLIKWRLIPELDLDSMFKLKCLLIGAGTLGCNVARSLLAWGIYNISFIDNGLISYSNPARQTLFTHKDVGKSKAIVAAHRLAKIDPNVISKGYQITIPMTGHQIIKTNEDENGKLKNSKKINENSDRNDKNETDKDEEKIIEIIEKHDVLFLLTDSRESRWLPAMLGAAMNKIVITIALGFDSFLVMRHGSNLGCYFCPEIRAPIDSISGRSLDQQCTVSRPGLSMIASGFGVELLASIIQGDNILQSGRELENGRVPHQIRGFLNCNEIITLRGDKSPFCIACSSKILDKYSQDGWSFIIKACTHQGYLEQITGGAELLAEESLKELSFDHYDDKDDF